MCSSVSSLLVPRVALLATVFSTYLSVCLPVHLSVTTPTVLASLALVGDVPEFHEGRGKLAALKDRLQRRVEGRLAEALQVGKCCIPPLPFRSNLLGSAAC